MWAKVRIGAQVEDLVRLYQLAACMHSSRLHAAKGEANVVRVGCELIFILALLVLDIHFAASTTCPQLLRRATPGLRSSKRIRG